MLLLSFGLVASAPAAAQTLHLNPVYVSLFHTAQGISPSEGDDLRMAVELELNQRYLTVRRGDIPAYEDYDVDTYERACPEAEREGCAFVVGERGQAEWVVAGLVFRSEESTALKVTFIDVRASRVALTVHVAADDPILAATQVGNILELVMASVEDDDVRGEVEDPVLARARRRDNAAELAATLDVLEEELGQPVEREASRLERPRITSADLAEYRERDDVSPWEIVDMGEAEYLRYKNSGLDLLSWRALARGRLWRPVVSVAVGAGTGPWGAHLDARWALDEYLEHAATEAFLELRDASGSSFVIEVGMGVHRFGQVSVWGATRASSVTWILHNEVVGQIEPEPEPEEALRTSWQVGVRGDLVPMPTSTVRPLVTAAVSSWTGPTFDFETSAADYLPEFHAPQLLVVQGGIGAEASLSRHVLAFVRIEALLGFGGARQGESWNAELLYHRGTLEDHSPLGFQIAIGARALIDPLFGPRERPPDWADEP